MKASFSIKEKIPANTEKANDFWRMPTTVGWSLIATLSMMFFELIEVIGLDKTIQTSTVQNAFVHRYPSLLSPTLAEGSCYQPIRLLDQQEVSNYACKYSDPVQWGKLELIG